MWLLLSFIFAFFDSLQSTYYKAKAVQIHPVHMAWSVLVISSICYLPLLLLGIPHLDTAFWFAVFFRLIIDSCAFTLFIKGVQKSPLSLTIPMTSLNPVLSVVTVFFLSRLLPSPVGLFGIILTVGGIYLLHFDKESKNIFSPFQSIFKEKGVLYVAIAASLWSIVAALQKFAIDHSNLYFYTSFFQLLWAICFTPIAYFIDRKKFISLFHPQQIKLLLPGGMLDAIKTIAQNAAFVLTIPAYVNSIGNTSILFSTIFGVFLFQEKIRNHIIPITIIFIGVTLIIFGQ